MDTSHGAARWTGVPPDLGRILRYLHAPAKSQGRARELDATQWAGGRLDVQILTGNGCAWGIGPATLPLCRPGLPAQVLPDQDDLVCNATADIASPHLVVATAAQNYGKTPIESASLSISPTARAPSFSMPKATWCSCSAGFRST